MDEKEFLVIDYNDRLKNSEYEVKQQQITIANLKKEIVKEENRLMGYKEALISVKEERRIEFIKKGLDHLI